MSKAMEAIETKGANAAIAGKLRKPPYEPRRAGAANAAWLRGYDSVKVIKK